ncbi:uncharacterized protein METZ01_LOCUS201447 [marine metagenome]|uniref:Uncharacterized protein n=1 Tax=marine metagenome TaxID=408172 RepID=A0A382EF54_9ZZZZ
MDLYILITILITAIVQSIFGTGVLLFGTPLLLILGYNFQYALIILLPTSILISFFQLKNNLNKIDIQFYKRLLLFSIPLIILFLYLTNLNSIKINLFVGIFLVVVAIKENILSINRLIKFLIKYESLYLMIMGMIHGITNLGGALLSAIVFSKNLSKDSKRTTIAICYLTFALFQIITLIVAFNNNSFLNIFNFVYWILGPVIFFIVEKYLYFRIDGGKYIKYSNFFLFILGLMLIIIN